VKVINRPAPGPGDCWRVPGPWVKLMAALGYQRFAAHGADIGSYIIKPARRRIPRAPGRRPRHLPGRTHLDPADPGLPEDARSFLAARPRQRETGGAYAHLHRSNRHGILARNRPGRSHLEAGDTLRHDLPAPERMICAAATQTQICTLTSAYSAICLDPPPGGPAEPITLRDRLACVWKQLLGCPVTN
jgi:hypothetical protein